MSVLMDAHRCNGNIDNACRYYYVVVCVVVVAIVVRCVFLCIFIGRITVIMFMFGAGLPHPQFYRQMFDVQQMLTPSDRVLC